MKKYKLIDAIKERTKIQVVQKVNGVTRYGYAQLEPGKVYIAEDDELFIQSLYNAKIQKRYTASLEEELKAQGVPYEVTQSKCCGGRRKMLSYCVVEVFTDG